MIFAGFVPLYREFLGYTTRMDNRRMTNNEALVYVWLLGLADHRTGSYRINVPGILAFLPGLGKDAAQRALAGLQRKRYIYREIKPRSTLYYRYWIEGYRVTDGEHKALQLDLSEVFATKDPSRVRYVKPAPEGAVEGAPEGAVEGAPEGADKNNKEQEIRENKQSTIPLTDKGKGASQVDAGVSLSESRKEAKGEPSGKGGATLARTWCDPGSSEAPLRFLEGSQEAPIPKAQAPVPAPRPAAVPVVVPPPQPPAPVSVRRTPPANLPIHWVGSREDGEWFHDGSGEKVGWLESKPLIAKARLEQFGPQFFDLATGNEVPWADAYERITGRVISGRDAA